MTIRGNAGCHACHAQGRLCRYCLEAEHPMLKHQRDEARALVCEMLPLLLRLEYSGARVDVADDATIKKARKAVASWEKPTP